MAKQQPEHSSEILFYTTEDGLAKVEVRLENETVWLSQAQMVELFQTTKQNISLHIRNIFSEGELQEDSVVKEYLTTAADGKKYRTNFYNLDVIISVGYRVKSHRGRQFRIWATQQLKEYIIKGFVLNDERLKETGHTNPYFDELKDLNLIVDQYLSFAELQARNRKPMYMADWAKKLNDFLTLNDREILEHAGRISAQMARELAEGEYKKYHQTQIMVQDTQEMKALEEGIKKLESHKKKK